MRFTSSIFSSLVSGVLLCACSFDGEVIPPSDSGGSGGGVGTTGGAGGLGGGASTCTTIGDCPTGTRCQTPTCSPDGVCGLEPMRDGTVLDDVEPGDCKGAVCDAMGGVVVVDDNADLPLSDSNPCTAEMCSSGEPLHSSLDPGPVPPENGSECPGVCQANAYAGTCGYRLYSKVFPGGGDWSSEALSVAWNDPNAPPPSLSPGIAAADATSNDGRLMVFGADGNYYERLGTIWQTPVLIETRFPDFPSDAATKLSCAGSANYFNMGEDLLALLTLEPNPQAIGYRIPLIGGGPPVFDSAIPVTNESQKPNAPTQHLDSMTWCFNEQRGTYGSTNDAVTAWKGVNGNVYMQHTGDFSYPAAPQSEANSSLELDGRDGAPAPGTAVAMFYSQASNTVYVIAP